MFYYKFLDEKTKQLEAWTESKKQAEIADLKLSMEQEPEQAYDGNWYVAGYAPAKPDEVLAEEKRADRNRLLQESDIRMLPDFTISAEEKEQWLLYRQYLRDITKDPAFPNVDVLNFANWLGQIHSKEPVLGAE